MSNTVNYTDEGSQVVASKDGIIIRKHFHGFVGGRALDFSQLKSGDDVLLPAYTGKVVPCGMPIIAKTTDGVTTYKPLPPLDVSTTSGGTTTTTYEFDLPSGWAYVGICGATVITGKAVSVMDAGVVNEVVMLAHLEELFPSSKQTPDALSLSALKSACPHLIFEKDEAYS